MFAMPNSQMFNPMMGGGYGFNPVARPGMFRSPGVQPGNIPFMGMGGGYPSIAYRGPMPTSSRYGAPPPMFGDISGIVGLMAQKAARAAGDLHRWHTFWPLSRQPPGGQSNDPFVL